jgi:hypothetical protein
MVRGAGCRAHRGKVPYEPTERWPVRQQNRKVKKPETSALGRHSCTRTFVKHDQRGVIVISTKRRMRAVSNQ